MALGAIAGQVAGSALSGALGGGGGGGPQQVTQTVDIPDFLRPFLEQQANVGQGALNNLSGRLSGATADDLVAPFSQDQLAAFDMARGATSQGGALPTAMDAFQSTARGDFLFGGQGFDEAVNAAMRQAQPHILSRFGGSGRGTGGLAQAAIGQAATDAFAGQFGQERQRQMQAAQMLPQLASQGVNMLGNIGQQQQQHAQQRLMAPITAQQQLLDASGGPVSLANVLGQTRTSESLGGGGSDLASALLGGLGGAMTGSQIGGMEGSPFGAGTGAIGGGVLGGIGGLLG